MAEYLVPDVYVEEIERGPRPIEAVPTNTAAFLGPTERGPTRPRLVTGYNDYVRRFGGDVAVNPYMRQAVHGFFNNGGMRLYVCRIVTGQHDPASHDFGAIRVQAVGPGANGRNVWVRVLPSDVRVPDPANPGATKPVGNRVRVAYWTTPPDAFFDPFENRNRRPRPSVTEEFLGVVLDDEAAPDHFSKRINGISVLIEMSVIAGQAPPATLDESSRLDAGGEQDDGPPTLPDYIGDDNDPMHRRGLAALLLDRYREVALVYAPGSLPREIVDAVVSHCENQRFRFAVLDSPENSSNVGDIDPRTTTRESQYAAFYYPWMVIADPDTGARRKVPPGGHVLGVYARSDTERGVFKAPANEQVRGAIDLEYDIDDGAQGVLNPRGVNVIRQRPGLGIRVWGARTLAANTLWKYVSVRRLFIFIERSIYEGTQWVVFEPNDERLWGRVRDTVRLFLLGQWRAGALMGTSEREAFRIACDRTTMTQDDILNGRLVCEIGIAPVRPAEFVIFRVYQNTAESQE